MPAAPRTLDRRQFVTRALTVAGVTGTALAVPAVAGAADERTTTVTAWRLKTEGWSQPRGYPLRTHCKCRACVGHAANKLYATLADAQNPALRAHPGCLCEPEQVSIAVPAAAVTAATSGSAASGRAAVRPVALVFPQGARTVDRRTTPTTTVRADGTVRLAYTGSDVVPLFGAGVVGVVAGSVLLAVVRRRGAEDVRAA